VRQLLPVPSTDADPVAAYVAADRVAPADRPWLLVNMVVSADGATAIDGRAGGMGGDADRRLFHALREVPDVILVGAGTARAENYGPAKPRPGKPAPRVAVVTASGDLDPSLRLFAEADPAAPPPIVITGSGCPADRLGQLDARAEIIQTGADVADLGLALGALRQRGAAIVLCEGGPALNGQLIARDLVDEWCLSLAPLLVGGISARAAVGDPVSDPRPLVLDRLLEDDTVCFARYLRAERATITGIASTAP
jgi:riboflavin biosynthesis pyrimidine reductase